MRTLFLLFFLLFCHSRGSAQLTFEKAYKGLAQVEVAKSVVEDGNGNYIIASGDKFNSTLLTREFGLAKLNAFGDTLWYTKYTRGFHPILRAVKKASDGYYIIGQCDDSTQTSLEFMLWLCKFDSLGNIQWKRYLTNPMLDAYSYTLNFDVLPDNSLLVCRGKATFTVISNSGTIINIKNYSSYDASLDYFQKGKLMKKDSTYYFFFYGNFSVQNNRILRVNELGDTLGSMAFVNDSAKGGEQIVKFIGNDYLITGYKPFLIPSNLFITRIDSVGNMLWYKKVPFLLRTTGTNYYYSSFTTLKNGNTVICGLPRAGGVLDALPTGRAFLYCFNDNGDSLWYKSYSPSDSTAKTEFFDVVGTSDSGMIACGQILFSNGQQKSYIVKLDSNGNLFNPLSVLEKNKENYLHLYPNPANAYTSIHYIGIEKNVTLTILNSIGQIIYTQVLNSQDQSTIINTSKFETGIYICSISDQGRTILNKKLVVIR